MKKNFSSILIINFTHYFIYNISNTRELYGDVYSLYECTNFHCNYSDRSLCVLVWITDRKWIETIRARELFVVMGSKPSQTTRIISQISHYMLYYRIGSISMYALLHFNFKRKLFHYIKENSKKRGVKWYRLLNFFSIVSLVK